MKVISWEHHHFLELKRSRFWDWLFKKNYPRLHLVVCLNPEEAELFREAGCTVQVIPNFVDTERFHQQDKEHFKKMLAPHGERILVHVSNFRKVKRVEDAIRIFAIVHKELPSKLLMPALASRPSATFLRMSAGSGVWLP